MLKTVTAKIITVTNLKQRAENTQKLDMLYAWLHRAIIAVILYLICKSVIKKDDSVEVSWKIVIKINLV